MATAESELRMKSNANNILPGLNESLQRKDYVDVTLAADGHFFHAHRLILSSISPYFREMFNQMPNSQQNCGKILNGIFDANCNESNHFINLSFTYRKQYT